MRMPTKSTAAALHHASGRAMLLIDDGGRGRCGRITARFPSMSIETGQLELLMHTVIATGRLILHLWGGPRVAYNSGSTCKSHQPAYFPGGRFQLALGALRPRWCCSATHRNLPKTQQNGSGAPPRPGSGIHDAAVNQELLLRPRDTAVFLSRFEASLGAGSGGRHPVLVGHRCRPSHPIGDASLQRKRRRVAVCL